jgi:tryptophan synthase alpha chain
MNRIEQIFGELRRQGRGAVLPFITAGYPTLETTAAILPAIEQAGVRICELGIPFSDPIADGPVIQASMTEALKHRLTPQDVFTMVKGLRSKVKLGLVAMVSYSIVFRMGVDRFVSQAADAGFDGFIFPDLPLEEAESVSKPVRAAGMISSLLIAPTTSDERAAAIARACSGFVYLVARTGITGERSSLPVGLEERVAKLRKVTDLPIAVGFGIGRPEHVGAVTRVADAAIVGSAVVKRIGEHAGEKPAAIAAAVAKFVGELNTGVESCKLKV